MIMSNLTKHQYLRPIIKQIYIAFEHTLAASSITISAGGDHSNRPQIEDWIEEVDNYNLHL